MICLGHDIERGLGHIGVDPELAALADSLADRHLDEMLAVEQAAGVRATYNVVGCLFRDVSGRIRSHGHALAFHSFDHRIEKPQLARCREMDPTVKGYRPPQSRITAELTARNLRRHRFQWLASSAHSLGIHRPERRRGIVRIPILFDDYDLYAGALAYPAWEERALEAIRTSDFVAFSLHDCYAHYWLPHYRAFLGRVTAAGLLRTFDEVAAELTAGAWHWRSGWARRAGTP